MRGRDEQSVFNDVVRICGRCHAPRMKYPLIRLLGLNLCKGRDHRNLSQEKMAEILGMERRQVQRIEAGDTDPGFISILGFRAALGASPDELLHGLTLGLDDWKRLKVEVMSR